MELTEISPEQKQAAILMLKEYQGGNGFMNSVKSALNKYGDLTEKQAIATHNFFVREGEKQKRQREGLPVGDFIELLSPVFVEIKGGFVHSLSEKLEMGNVKSYAWVVHEISRITKKAILVRAKIAGSEYSLHYCRICGRKLTDQFSQATGMGKVCAGHMEIPYIKDLSEVAEFKLAMDRRIQEIGMKEFWLPVFAMRNHDSYHELVEKYELSKNK